MSIYHYRAFDASGRAVSGVLDAESLSTMENRLRGEGLWLLDARRGRAAAQEEGVSRLKIKRGELTGFFLQMPLLLRAGITLPQALARLAEDFKDEQLGPVAAGLHERVILGVPLHRAMAAYPRIFPPQTLAIVQAGEISGRLPEVFESLSSYYEWLAQLIGDIRQALVYPVMVSIAAMSMVLMLFTFVVPRFVGLLGDLSLEIPLLTRVVIFISDLLLRGWPVIVALGFGVPVGLKFALRSPSFARGFDRALMRLPIFGDLVAMFALSRFTNTLGMLYRAGIPLLRGLDVCRNVVGNRAIAQALDEARQRVAEGALLSRCLGKYDFFPPTLVTMIATGESSGSLDFSLQSISNYYNRIIPRRIKVIFAIFDPAIMIFLIGVVGCVALAVVLPILQLWQAG